MAIVKFKGIELEEGTFTREVYDDCFELYDEKGNMIYREDAKGFWIKGEYDKNENMIYCEDSEGFWSKYEYDKNGNMIYCKTQIVIGKNMSMMRTVK